MYGCNKGKPTLPNLKVNHFYMHGLGKQTIYLKHGRHILSLQPGSVRKLLNTDYRQPTSNMDGLRSASDHRVNH